MVALSYSDVDLIPELSDLPSRAKADISVEFLGRKFKAPWLPANMSSVVNEDICKWLSQNGYFYIMHRFGDNRKFVQRARAEAWNLVSISVGVNQSDKDFISELAETKCRIHYITIDVAHGHHTLVCDMIAYIKALLPSVKVIAGNVTTLDAVDDLADWGADAAKVGIAGGAACSTKNMTGFHVPMFTCVKECSAGVIPIIADGGVRENGRISKALVAGATMVMAGSIFAACKDAPGESIAKWHRTGYYKKSDTIDRFASKKLADGTFLDEFFQQSIYKQYFGSASAKQKGSNKNVEGFETEILCNGLTYEQKYAELTGSLQSAVSYSGGENLKKFVNVKYTTRI